MTQRRCVQWAMIVVTVVAAALSGLDAAPWWLIVALVASAIVIARRPLGAPVPTATIDALERTLEAARGERLPRSDTPALVTPWVIIVPDARRSPRPLTWPRDSLILRDELPPERWRRFATALRLQRNAVVREKAWRRAIDRT